MYQCYAHTAVFDVVLKAWRQLSSTCRPWTRAQSGGGGRCNIRVIPKLVGGVLWRTSPGEIDVKSSDDTVITQNNWSLWISPSTSVRYLGLFGYILSQEMPHLFTWNAPSRRSQETVNGQKHMDAASAASKAREAQLDVQKAATFVADIQPIFKSFVEKLRISWRDNNRCIPHCDQDSSWVSVPWTQMLPLWEIYIYIYLHRHDGFSWAKKICRSSMATSTYRSWSLVSASTWLPLQRAGPSFCGFVSCSRVFPLHSALSTHRGVTTECDIGNIV